MERCDAFYVDKFVKNHLIRYNIYSVIVSTFIVISHYIRNPNWFTTDNMTIDPWIYWGAGNNIPLSYQADFSKTYYLERYTITFPQTVFQYIFGPYWSQLFLVTTYIFIICLTIFLILHHLNLTNLATPAILIFFSNHKFLGVLAMSYNQATSFTLYVGFTYTLLRYIQTQSRKFIYFAGILIGFLANAYIPHFIVTYVVAIFLIISYGSFSELIGWLKLSFIGFILAQFFIQTIHYLIARDYQIVLLKHFYYGFHLSTQKNPWGGDGPIWFWSKGVFSAQGFFWTALLIMAVAMIGIRHNDFHVRMLNLTGIGTFFGMAIFTFGKTNIVGYSWFACILYWIFLPAIIFLLYNLPIYLRYLFLTVFLLFHYFKSDGIRLLVAKVTTSHDFRLWIVVVLIVVVLITHFVSSVAGIVTSLLILILSLIMQSSYFISSEGGMEKGIDAQATYNSLNLERKGLEKLRKESGRRIWITPLEQVPLQSSMLYMYSLVSIDPNKSDCSQISWLQENKSLLVVTHSDTNKEEYVAKTFLVPCGVQKSVWKNKTVNDIRFSYLPLGAM